MWPAKNYEGEVRAGGKSQSEERVKQQTQVEETAMCPVILDLDFQVQVQGSAYTWFLVLKGQ